MCCNNKHKNIFTLSGELRLSEKCRLMPLKPQHVDWKIMKKHLLAAAISLAVSTAGAATYTINSKHTHARLSVDHFATGEQSAGFYHLSGNMQFNPQSKTGFADIIIPVDTVRSGSEEVNDYLKSAELFYAARYPQIRFRSTRFHFEGSRLDAVSGSLTMRGKTAPVTLKATQFKCYQHVAMKKEVCKGDFKTEIDRTRWGIDSLATVGMSKKVKVDIRIEAAKQ